MMKTKVCYILPSYDPAESSHFFHLYEFLRQASRDLDIFLIIEKAKTRPLDFPHGVYCQKFSWLPFRVLELFVMLSSKRIVGYKCFYTHYSFAGAASSWLVSRIFGGVNFYWNCGMPWQYRRGRFEEAAFRFALRHSVFVTGTAGLAAAYQRHYGLKADNIRVIPNWVDTRRFSTKEGRQELRGRLNIPEGARVVLFVHRLSRRKGSHRIIPVAQEVMQKLGNVAFLIVGFGPEYDSLKSEIKNVKLEAQVRLAGEVANRDIPWYFHAADIFFMPSEEEGFPHVLLESMAAGVPYAASDVGGVREITPQEFSEYILPGGDIKGFSEAIVKLLTLGEAEKRDLIRRGKEWVMQYDVDAVLPKFVSLFQIA